MNNWLLQKIAIWEEMNESNTDIFDQQYLKGRVLTALDYYLKHGKVECGQFELFDMEMLFKSVQYALKIDLKLEEKFKDVIRAGTIQGLQAITKNGNGLLTDPEMLLWAKNASDSIQHFLFQSRTDCLDNEISSFGCTYTILVLALAQMYISSRIKGTSVELPPDIDEKVQVWTQWTCALLQYLIASSLLLSAYNSCQSHSIHELSKLTKALISIIQRRDVSWHLITPDTYIKLETALRMPFFQSLAFHCEDRVASFFTIASNREAAFLAQDINKTKRIRADRIFQPRSDEMDKTWAMIKEDEEKLRLHEISIQIREHEKHSTVLMFHIDYYGALHCCVLNDEVNLISFPAIHQEDLISKIEMLPKPCNIDIPRDFSFFADRKDEIDPLSTKTRTAETDTERGEGNMNAPKPPSLTPLQKATAKLREMNARWARKHLFKILLHPLENFIKGTKLIIIPDKFLFLLPFSCLLDECDKSLSMTYNIQIVPTLHYLLSCLADTPHSPTIGPAMCVGNPNLEGIAKHESEQGNMTPRPLHYADVEAQQIAALFNTNPITGLHATKKTIFANLEKVSILHIASHGESKFGSIFLSPDFNLPYSALAEQQAFLLRELDLFALQTSARLVFLSCCCTARGAVLKEGVFGIARAFLNAGARCVIMTLWPINDSVTSEFAHRFYTKLFHEKSACEALQLTMIEFQEDRNPVYQLFTSWAPFQVLGEDVRFTKEEIKEIRRQGDAKVSYFDHYDK